MVHVRKCNPNDKKYDRFATEFADKFFGEFDSVFNEFTREFDQNFGGKFQSIPAVNVFENETEFRLDISAAGLSREAFKIKLEHQILTISAERPEESEGEKFIRKEFGFGRFKRSFRLPKSVDKEQITAQYQDGILKVHLPKLESTEAPTRDIEIS